MSPFPSKIVFFDLETAGLDYRRHPIIQIAAIAVGPDLVPLDTFEVKIRFDLAKANRNSLRKNHYCRGTWANEAVEPLYAARRFARFLRRHATAPVLASDGTKRYSAQLAAHNAAFDGPFLQAWYAKLGVFLPARRHVLCTMQRALWHFGERPASRQPRDYKLATLCQHFGVGFHAAAAHEALADVTATLALYRRMVAADARLPLALSA
jgi:DNA polymerase III epsilon subunit-like protein